MSKEAKAAAAAFIAGRPYLGLHAAVSVGAAATTLYAEGAAVAHREVQATISETAYCAVPGTRARHVVNALLAALGQPYILRYRNGQCAVHKGDKRANIPEGAFYTVNDFKELLK